MTKGGRRGKQEAPLVFDACLGNEITNKTKQRRDREEKVERDSGWKADQNVLSNSASSFNS